MNEAALKGALVTVDSLEGGVRQLVEEGVAQFQERVQQQGTLSQQNKENILQLLVRNTNTSPTALNISV